MGLGGLGFLDLGFWGVRVPGLLGFGFRIWGTPPGKSGAVGMCRDLHDAHLPFCSFILDVLAFWGFPKIGGPIRTLQTGDSNM